MTDRVSSPATYAGVFGALIGLTVLTVGMSFLDLGAWHTAAGLTIAAGKALLVVLFFMHLLYSKSLIWIVAGGALFWLGILLVLTMADYLTRDWLSY
jgi:cytochrome c oxidase subunit 4